MEACAPCMAGGAARFHLGQSHPRFLWYLAGLWEPHAQSRKDERTRIVQPVVVVMRERMRGPKVHECILDGPAPYDEDGYFWPARMSILFHIGRYFLLLKETFGRPERLSLYWSRTLEEMDLLGVKSLGIVALLSAFMGAVITIQTKTNIDSPLIQAWVWASPPGRARSWSLAPRSSR